jgi:hypothetical protein
MHEPAERPGVVQTTIRVRGEDVEVPSVPIGRCRVIVTGRWLRTARLFDEELVERAHAPSPSAAVDAMRDARLRADVFTFAAPFGSSSHVYPYPVVEDNLAVLSTKSYDHWWTGLPQESRRNVRLAAKRGVVARPAEFDEQLVAGIKRVYDETPVRQGRRFWHFDRDIGRVRMMNATYLPRSQFIGAYVGRELVGFIKYVRVDEVAVVIQILAMELHREKRAVYALLRQAVELCQSQGLEFMTHGKFSYGVDRDSTLSEFKRRTGFAEHRFPRYFVPLTTLGNLAVRTGMHLGWRKALPIELTTVMRRVRAGVVRGVNKRTAHRSV